MQRFLDNIKVRFKGDTFKLSRKQIHVLISNMVIILTAEYFFEDKKITEEQLAFLRMITSKYGIDVKGSNLSLGETRKFVDIFSEILPGKSIEEKIKEFITGSFKLTKAGETTEFKLI